MIISDVLNFNKLYFSDSPLSYLQTSHMRQTSSNSSTNSKHNNKLHSNHLPGNAAFTHPSATPRFRGNAPLNTSHGKPSDDLKFNQNKTSDSKDSGCGSCEDVVMTSSASPCRSKMTSPSYDAHMATRKLPLVGCRGNETAC